MKELPGLRVGSGNALWQRLRLAGDNVHLRLMTWAVVVGVGAGLLGGGFRAGLTALGDGRRAAVAALGDGWGSWLIAGGVAAALVCLAAFLVRRFAPEAGGSGVQEIEGALDGVRPVRWRRVIPVKFGAGLAALASGLAMGREGPTIQMGGCVGQLVGEKAGLSDDRRHVLVAAGAGAGLAAAFNAPFAGILFVVEEMRPQFRYSIPSVQAVVLACATADLVVRAMLGGRADIPMMELAAPPAAAYWLFLVFGTLFGFLGVAFSRILIAMLDFAARRPPLVLAAAVGAITGILALVEPAVVGQGHEVLLDAITGRWSLSLLLLVFAARFLTTPMSYATGAPGGIFTPMLALATVFGMAYGEWTHGLFPHLVPEPTLFAVAGMGALFAAVVRAPLTGIILTAEITQNFGQILPLMVTCVAATIVAHALGEQPVYTTLLGRTLKKEGAESSAASHAGSAPGS